MKRTGLNGLIRNTLTAMIPLLFLATAFVGSATVPSGAMGQKPLPSDNLPQPEKQNHALYIAMPDGMRLAADIWFPEEALKGKAIPALVSFTRYWRAMETIPETEQMPPEAKFFTKHGYAYMVVDVRGTGASFGTRSNEFTISETRDFSHIIDWISRQNWSNGAVASIGISYSGNTAENATFDPPPALKAAIPRFTDFDWYLSLLYPGGLKNKIITSDWGIATRALDLNDVTIFDKRGDGSRDFTIIGVKPVDADAQRTVLADAVAQHQANTSVDKTFGTVEFRDDIPGGGDITTGPPGDIVSPYQYMDDASHHKVPTYHWASWMDAGTASGAIARFVASDVPAKYVIGAWSHGAFFDSNPYAAPDAPLVPDTEAQYQNILAFLAPYMTPEGNMPSARKSCKKELYYYVMGENRWRRTTSWPPEGTTSERLYFGENRTLRQNRPTTKDGHDIYRVDADFGTGTSSRWSTQMGGGDVDYSGVTDWQKRLLVYSSAPLDKAIEITGHPVVKLFMSSTTTDGQIIAYLQDVAPDGQVRVISEGHLRLVDRQLSDEQPPYPVFGPYHTFLREDAVPMPAGKTEHVQFVMLPTSALIEKGHIIRVAIAGQDKDSFVRIPAEGNPVYRIERTGTQPSHIEIPVISRNNSEGMGHDESPFTTIAQCH